MRKYSLSTLAAKSAMPGARWARAFEQSDALAGIGPMGTFQCDMRGEVKAGAWPGRQAPSPLAGPSPASVVYGGRRRLSEGCFIFFRSFLFLFVFRFGAWA